MIRMLTAALLLSVPSFAASGGDLGKELSAHGGLLWVVPFAGLLLSIALMPLAIPKFWHHHYGKVSAFWAAAFVVPFSIEHGFGPSAHHVFEVLLHEYVPFVLLLGSLYVISGGVVIEGGFDGSPKSNATLLALGTAIASFVGTTGASMLLIRPLLRANRWRTQRSMVVVFFIFLVSNVGGSLTPLGDPPLFLGYLRGVPFFWTVPHLIGPMLLATVILLVVYFALDSRSFAKEDEASRDSAATEAGRTPFRIQGGVNLALLGGVVLAVWGGGALALEPSWKDRSVVLPGGLELGVVDVMRDAALLVLGLLSLKLTSKEIRARNDFSWGAIAEVAKLFAGIFIAMIPAMAILAAGKDGALAAIVRAVNDPAHYFWATGALSSFLDNAPTYVVFFETARATPVAEFVARGIPDVPVSGSIAIPESILSAISAGAVFMGANTYIGNGPNFMVKSMAQEHGVKMPSFFGYMAWSIAILVPIFILMTFVFFV